MVQHGMTDYPKTQPFVCNKSLKKCNGNKVRKLFVSRGKFIGNIGNHCWCPEDK